MAICTCLEDQEFLDEAVVKCKRIIVEKMRDFFQDAHTPSRIPMLQDWIDLRPAELRTRDHLDEPELDEFLVESGVASRRADIRKRCLMKTDC